MPIQYTKLNNYPDSKCIYGYMTICIDCIKGSVPKHVDRDNPIDSSKQYLPGDRCELCNRKGIIE